MLTGVHFSLEAKSWLVDSASSYEYGGQCTTTQIDLEVTGDDGFWAGGSYYWESSVSDNVEDPAANTYSASPIYYSLNADYYHYEEECEDNFDPAYGEADPLNLTISGPDSVWLFDGASGDDGDSQSTISLTSDAGSPTYWWIETGSDKAYLQTTSGASVVLESLAQSDYEGDVRVAASWGGSTYAARTVTVRRPHHLVHTDYTNICYSGSYPSFDSYEDYYIVDQLNQRMSARTVVNEHWMTGIIRANQSYNWGRQDPGSSSTNSAGAFEDHISMTDDPLTVPHVDCNSVDPVDEWDQDWFVGSRTIGVGARVQKDTLTRLRSKGFHNGIVSPPQ